METRIRLGKIRRKKQQIEIPSEYLGREVEIIIRSDDQSPIHAPSDKFQALELSTRGFRFDRDEINAR